MAQQDKDDLVTEIMSMCEELGVEIDSNIPDEKNKFLSAWHKGASGPPGSN